MRDRHFKLYILLCASVFLVIFCRLAEAEEGEGAQPRSTNEALRSFTLAATGDLLLHRAVGRSARAFADQGGWSRTLSGLASAIDASELGVVNVETPLTESVVSLRSGDHPVLGAPPDVAEVLSKAGVDVASVANNHAFDQDSEGLSLTMAALGEAQICPVGAGSSADEAMAPVVVTHDNVRIAFISVTGPMNQRHRTQGERMYVARLRDEEALLASVRSARDEQRRADVVVVLLHWMWDYRERPRRYERRLARRLIEAGADVLIGAGPHLLHTVDRFPSSRGEAIVAWSLGNLISAMGMRWRPGFRAPPDMHPVSILPGTRDAVVLHIDAEISGDGRLSFPGLRATPLWTINNWMPRQREPSQREDIRIIPLSEAPQAVRDSRRPAIQEALGSEVNLDQ